MVFFVGAAAHLSSSFNNGKTRSKRTSSTRSRSARRRGSNVEEFGKRPLAARRIQRAYRRYSAVKNVTDPITLEPFEKNTDVLIVEPSGKAAFRFNARALAAHALLSSQFLHPVTGREWLLPELRRIGVRAGVGSNLLLAAYSVREVVIKHKNQRESLSTYMENEMRSLLTRALVSAAASDQALLVHPFDERTVDRLENEVIDTMDDYCALSEKAARWNPESCQSAIAADLAHFADTVCETTIDEDGLSPAERIVHSALKDARREASYRMRDPRPKTALASWLQDTWRGR